MMISHNPQHGLGDGSDPDVSDLIDAADGLERDLALEAGSLIRELTSMINRRRRFEGLKRHHDARRL